MPAFSLGNPYPKRGLRPHRHSHIMRTLVCASKCGCLIRQLTQNCLAFCVNERNIFKDMKNLLEKILNLLPYLLLILLFGLVFVFAPTTNPDYDQYLGILRILAWPAVVIVIALFFRKVFTYLFFSMSEFNFFGAKGGLKDIREVIEEKVEERILEKETLKKRGDEIKLMSSVLEKIVSSGPSVADTNELVNQSTWLFNAYKELSKEHEETVKELNYLRRRQEDREARTAYIKEQVRQRAEKLHG